MANTSNFKNGLIFNHKGNLWKIVEFLHVKPGKGGAFVRSKLKNIKTGQVVEETFRAGRKIVEVRIDARDFNYLYNDGTTYYFMDKETFEQIQLTNEQTKDINEFFPVKMNEIKLKFRLKFEKKLSKDAIYTFWGKLK